MTKTIKRILRLFVAGIVTAAGTLAILAGFAAYSYNASPVDLDKVYEVSQADSMQMVEELLGTPDHMHQHTAHGKTLWIYSNALIWHEFLVEFDRAGKVMRFTFQD